ncbi:MAG TPA: hypothetical protein VFQ53_22245 [Kofleriaceae bacterium]|nr:hypothetical protein [Kofleriaceae bacterium]
MKKKLLALSAVTLLGLTGTAFAEWTIRNDDHSSYELVKECGGKKEDWSIAGKVEKKLSIPAGATSCTITVKSTSTSCTVKDGEGCVIASGKITRK